jgi:hypothetical protein
LCRQGGNQDGREAPESPPGPPQSAPGGVREPRRGARAGRGRHRRPRAAPRKAPETAGAADTQSRSTGGRKKHPILRKMTFHEGFGGVTGTAPERRSSKTWPTVETGSEIPTKTERLAYTNGPRIDKGVQNMANRRDGKRVSLKSRRLA